MDRRSFLRTAGISTAATAVLSNEVLAQENTPNTLTATPQNIRAAANRSRLKIQSTISPWNPGPNDWNATTIGHLYRRAGFGATLAEVAAAQGKTYSAVVDALLNDSLLAPVTPPTDSDKWLHVQPDSSQAEMIRYQGYMRDIRSHWTAQMAQPASMLREKMTLFWMNHFCVEETKVYYPQLMYSYLDYFRQHAWGDFKQMVKDVTVHPAMLRYLDGIYNIGRNPNENYARELQELFTMGPVWAKDGVTPNYTQDDVKAIAHILTGWDVDTQAPAPNILPTRYTISNHDSSFQHIYDDPTTGQHVYYNLDAVAKYAPTVTYDRELIDTMFAQRGERIAWFMCKKLYQYFVYHEPNMEDAATQAVIQGMVDTFMVKWSIKDVLSQLFKSEHFFDAVNIGAMPKSPVEHIVGMIRQFDLPVDELSAGYLYAYTYAQGQYILDPPNVKGWPGYHNWISTTTLPIRNVLAAALTVSQNHSIPTAGTDGNGRPYTATTLDDTKFLTWAKKFSNYGTDFDSMLAELSTFLCAQPLGPLALQYIKNQMPPNTYEWGTLDDTGKLSALRQMTNKIMLLAEYHLA
ncbi:MAG: DUF1800 domain-containing protein [Bacteroidetes bacterium]|nr:DUF1800 domain-containing protein [Bacteroidota bacterium]